jgi:Peptidase family M1 domain
MNSRTVFGLMLVLILLAGCAQRDKTAPLIMGEISLYQADYTVHPADFMLESELSLTWHPARIDTFFFMLHRDLDIGLIRAEGNAQQGELLMLASGEEIADRLQHHSSDLESSDFNDHLALYALPVVTEEESISIVFSYRGIIHDDVEIPEFSRWAIADETTGLISEKGAFLVPYTGYYPLIPVESGLSRFQTTINTPADWEGLAEGNLLDHTETSATFASVYPLDGSHLVAGPYILDTLMTGETEIAMYHYADDEELVNRYLTHSARYIAMYEEMIGSYPFERFSVVENWFPTGYGMPSYTLLGTDVLALPFIVYTSLGHEVLHNWWGNGVLVDYDNGNWCEGLTVYQADYIYSGSRDPRGPLLYRLNLLRDYADYVVRGEDDDFPVREFTSRTTAGSRTIGYGKVMMIFHMVSQKIGAEVFDQALSDLYTERQFEKLTWSDFFDKFEDVSGEKFGWYEKQWVDRGSAPSFEVKNPLVQSGGNNSNYLLEFDLAQVQEADPFKLDLPIRLHFASDSTADHVLHDVNGETYHARVQTSERPVRFDIDPDFNVFRILDPLEAPPTLSGFYGDEQPLVVLPAASDPMRDEYKEFAEALLSRSDPEFIEQDEAAASSLDGRAVLRLGRKNSAQRVRDTETLSANKPPEKDLALVWTSRNSERPAIVSMDVWAESPAALAPLARKLPHYGKYSYLAFTAGDNIAKGQWDVTDSPMIVAVP